MVYLDAVNTITLVVALVWLPLAVSHMDLTKYHSALENDLEPGHKKKQRHLIRLPDVVFPIAWMLEYSLITVSMVLFARTLPSGVDLGGMILAIWGLFIGYMFLNHSWSKVFFEHLESRAFRWVSALMTVAMILIAVAILVLMIVNGGLLASYILWVIHIPWLFPALYVNMNWAINKVA